MLREEEHAPVPNHWVSMWQMTVTMHYFYPKAMRKESYGIAWWLRAYSTRCIFRVRPFPLDFCTQLDVVECLNHRSPDTMEIEGERSTNVPTSIDETYRWPRISNPCWTWIKITRFVFDRFLRQFSTIVVIVGDFGDRVDAIHLSKASASATSGAALKIHEKKIDRMHSMSASLYLPRRTAWRSTRKRNPVPQLMMAVYSHTWYYSMCDMLVIQSVSRLHHNRHSAVLRFLPDRSLAGIAYPMSTSVPNTSRAKWIQTNRSGSNLRLTTCPWPSWDNRDHDDTFPSMVVCHLRFVNNNYLLIHVHYVNTRYVDDVRRDHISPSIYSKGSFASEDIR